MEKQQSQNSEKEIDKQNSTFEVKELENTPFSIIKKDNKFFGVMGSNRLTDFKENEEDIINELSNLNWDLVIKVVAILVEYYINLNKKEE